MIGSAAERLPSTIFAGVAPGSRSFVQYLHDAPLQKTNCGDNPGGQRKGERLDALVFPLDSGRV